MNQTIIETNGQVCIDEPTRRETKNWESKPKRLLAGVSPVPPCSSITRRALTRMTWALPETIHISNTKE
jgi:hypothetical protein